mgnify:CR=1 FL=1|tara:strand:+ start:676 stop:2085 length:1410 start_codon:yes stop_codon:yes gene_type:complete
MARKKTKKATKTFIGRGHDWSSKNEGKRRHSTKWQKLVSQHGIDKAKKHYAGYKQVPAPPTTTGNIRSVNTSTKTPKGGTRRVKDTKIGRGRRSQVFYKGDKVGSWTKSQGPNTKGRSGLGWYQERGYGTARKPVPDTPTTRRLGIANKGKESAGKPIMTPGAVAGLNEEEEWEMERAKKEGKKVKQAEMTPDDRDMMSIGEMRKLRQKDKQRMSHWRKGRRDRRRADTEQGYDDRDNESIGMRNRGGKSQDLKSRRDESAGMERAMGRKKYSDVSTMDTGGRMMAEGGEDLDNQDFMWTWQNAEEYGAEMTRWQQAVKTHGVPPKTRSKGHGHPAFKKYRGYSQKDGKLYHYGDLVGRWTGSGGTTRKNVNTGRGWFMERGYGTPRKPVPDTPLTRKLGIAKAGTQLRQDGGLFGRMKRMLVPNETGLNSLQDWELNYLRNRGAGGLFQAESQSHSCSNCGFTAENIE